MIEKEIKLNGGVVFWSLSETTDAKSLEAGLRAIGLDRFTAEPNTPNGAVKIALTKTYGQRGVKIDALPSGDGYVVTHLKGDNQNGVNTLDYEVAFSVEYSTDKSTLIFRSPKTGMVVQPNGHVNAQAIYSHEMSTTASHKVARCLKRIIGHLNGIALRDKGGLYWLPQSKMATFGDVARVVENAGSNSVYTVRTAHDTESVRAICAALTNEVNFELGLVNADIMNPEKKKRAKKTSQARAVNLRAQVAEYESILGTALDSLKDKCDDTDAAAATAILSAFGA